MPKNCLKLRLFPTKAQARLLDQTLETCRQVYNALLLDRKFQYETANVSVSRYDQQAYLPAWKKDHPELATVYSQTLQDVAHRVDLAFQAFFKRAEKGEQSGRRHPSEGRLAPGFPRFKGEGYDSLTYTQGANIKAGAASILFPKLGEIKARMHRLPWGVVKNATIRRVNGKWFACLCQDVEAEPLPPSDEQVGIDVGLKTFAALSNGEMIENPRFFRKDEAALAKAQRKQAKCAKRTKERNRANKAIRRIHERIRNRRHDFVHQTARKIVNRYGLIAVEKLNVKGMSRKPKPKPDTENDGQFLPNGASAKSGLAKSIADAAWSMFRSVLSQKAESAARQLVLVNPAYTSQRCSGCAYTAPKTLKERWHHCPMCGLSLDRDTNAAVNILLRGNAATLGI